MSRKEPSLQDLCAYLEKRMGWDSYDDYDCAERLLKMVREKIIFLMEGEDDDTC